MVQDLTLRLWCNPNVWIDAGLTGGVPADGDDVMIPSTWRIVVNCETAKLKNLEVRGTLIIP